jgi:hypothetical protein
MKAATAAVAAARRSRMRIMGPSLPADMLASAASMPSDYDKLARRLKVNCMFAAIITVAAIA